MLNNFKYNEIEYVAFPVTRKRYTCMMGTKHIIGLYWQTITKRQYNKAFKLWKSSHKQNLIKLTERSYKMEVDLIARATHEVNRIYCQSIGDYSQPHWEDAPDWQKRSAIMGVQYRLDNPNSKPEDSHNSWLKQKESEGWKYGAIKNTELKEHPCFVPYEELPVEQKLKDKIFQGTVDLLKK